MPSNAPGESEHYQVAIRRVSLRATPYVLMKAVEISAHQVCVLTSVGENREQNAINISTQVTKLVPACELRPYFVSYGFPTVYPKRNMIFYFRGIDWLS